MSPRPHPMLKEDLPLISSHLLALIRMCVHPHNTSGLCYVLCITQRQDMFIETGHVPYNLSILYSTVF